MLKSLTRVCPICAGASGSVLYTQQVVLPDGHLLPGVCDIIVCASCGFACADTGATQVAYDAYYARLSKYADVATGTGTGQHPWDRERLEGVAALIEAQGVSRSSRILDIGCANGGLLLALQARGFRHLCGVDPSPACVQRTRDTIGGDAWCGTLANLPADMGTFDGIVLSHVLEHVRDLQDAMHVLRTLLKPSGWVYLEVPDAMRYAQFVRSPFQDFNIEHINHFSVQSLANLCRVTGFAPVHSGTRIIPAAQQVPYPALYWFARPAERAMQPTPDWDAARALTEYVMASRTMLAQLDSQLRYLVRDSTPVIVWGVGQLTVKLLATTALRDADIAMFVDTNPAYHGTTLCGRPVCAPTSIMDEAIPILVASVINAPAIVESIRALHISNPVWMLDTAGPLHEA